MATRIQKTITLNKFEIIKYQLMHHCFMNGIRLTDTELSCLTVMGELGKIRLTEFNKRVAERGILGNPLSVSNCLTRLEHSGLFIKSLGGKKTVHLNPDLGIQSEGNILIELKLVKLENQTKQSVQKDSREAVVA